MLHSITRSFVEKEQKEFVSLEKILFVAIFEKVKMDSFDLLVRNTKAIWWREDEKKKIEILRNWDQLGSQKKSDEMYNLRKNYVIKEFAGVCKIVTKKEEKLMATKESVSDLIRDLHECGGHKGEKKTHKLITANYANVSRKLVTEYIKHCQRCVENMKKVEVTAGVVVRPILATYFNERGQVDLVDMQTLPDGDYNWIFHYQDHLSKYHFLRPLKCKTALEVAHHLMQIFVDFGAPSILQSDNGREFTASVIKVFFAKYFEFKYGENVF